MTAITTEDGSRIYFRDWGSGQPVVLSHGWPLNSDAWESQMLFLGQHGYRVVAHDRRGHGRSTQTWDGNDMDTYADDLASLFEALDLNDAILVGHSTGGGEVARYIGRHGTQRLAKAVLLDAVPPHLVKTATNPEGAPMEVFDAIRAGVRQDRAQYFYDFALPFYGYNRPGAKISRGIIEQFWRLSMQCGIRACYDCVAAFSETDFTEDLQKFDIPTLVVHGDDDQIVPIGVGGLRSAKMIKGATLKIYKGAPHGLAQTRSEEFNSDLLSFIESGRTAAVASSSPPASIH